MAAELPSRPGVVVAGAGIAGLATSRALHLRAIPSPVLERRQADEGGLAINLPGSAIAALVALGLGHELAKHGRPIGRREYRTSRGRLLFAVDEDAFWGAELRPRCLLRSDLLAMLGKDQPAGAILRETSTCWCGFLSVGEWDEFSRSAQLRRVSFPG